VPMTGIAPVHPQPTQLAEGPMVTPMAGAYHQHAQIWEAKERAKEQHAQNFFEA